MFNLSVVNIIPDMYLVAVNEVAGLYGCGESNITVKLQDSEGAIFWGCHAWWKPEHYAYFSNEELRNKVIPVELLPSLEFLYERLVLDGDAQENWQAALAELGLSPVEIPE